MQRTYPGQGGLEHMAGMQGDSARAAHTPLLAPAGQRGHPEQYGGAIVPGEAPTAGCNMDGRCVPLEEIAPMTTAV